MTPSPSKIKVLIADDSVVYRSQIRSALTAIPRVELAGASSSGKLTLERLSTGGVDLVILDLEMPEMDGIETLRELRRLGHSCKVLIFTSNNASSAELTLEALKLGATDFINKLEPKIQSLFPEKAIDPDALNAIPPSSNFPTVHWDLLRPKIILIGSSTGGPGVLEKIFADIHPPLSCPIVIAQHMPPVFTATFAHRLSSISGIPAREAEHGRILEPGCIHIAPGDHHLTLTGTPELVKMHLDQGPKVHSVRPAVDPLFRSAAKIFKNRCLAFVLTGMGADGRDGAIAVKQHGGAVVIQSERTCVVFGMPGAVHEAGAFDRIASPSEITSILKEKAVLHGKLPSAKP
ncbi:MAG: response regulator [Proteobacteria bacterium]|nr:response regulator [Pseudomonadota bacterium]